MKFVFSILCEPRLQKVGKFSELPSQLQPWLAGVSGFTVEICLKCVLEMCQFLLIASFFNTSFVNFKGFTYLKGMLLLTSG